MISVRHAIADDLGSLLALFTAGEVSAFAEPMERSETIWAECLKQPGMAIFVSCADNTVVATCTLITAPNLLRAGRRHGFLENVITHPDHRGQGHGAAVVQAALAEAWNRDCHHVLMQSGRKNEAVHRFYRNQGFEPNLRTAYVAHPPSNACSPN